MIEQKINRDKIDELVQELPSFYIRQLAQMVFGRASKPNRRKIKHWRSGGMADKIVEKKIFVAAQKLAKMHKMEA